MARAAAGGDAGFKTVGDAMVDVERSTACRVILRVHLQLHMTMQYVFDS